VPARVLRGRLAGAATLLAVAPALLAVSLIVAGCGDEQRGGMLEDAVWVLASYQADGGITSVPDTVYADLSFSEGQAGGSAGVNSFSGTYESGDEGTLVFGPLMSTQMAGPEDATAVETAVLAALAEVAEYYTDGETLELYDADGTVVLDYTKSTATLVGSWTATGYNNGKGGVVSLAPDSEITAMFGEDGSLAGSAGINTYNATYTTSGATIEIGPIRTTKMAGPPELMDQERLYLAALETAATYSVRGATLELRDDSGALQATYTPTAE
jgi:heat shock protein HslJ